MRNMAICLSAAAALFSSANAAEVVDQAQTLVDASVGFHGIGGDSNQKLAQTFTAGRTGPLIALRLPIATCGGGDLLIDIANVNADGTPGAVIRSTPVSPSEVPTSYEGLHQFYLINPVPVVSGTDYAFIVRMSVDASTSFCSYAQSPAGDTYPRGKYFFDSRPNPPGWVSSEEFAGPQDLAFQTIMDDGSGGASASACGVVALPGGGSIPADLPICRCLRDASLREFRCALLDPDFFAIRRIPWPIPVNSTYVERWDVLPLTKFDGPMRIDFKGDNIPAGASFKFKGKSFKVLDSRAMTLKSPGKPVALPGAAVFSYGGRKFQVDTTLPAASFGPNPKPDFKSIKVPPQQ